MESETRTCQNCKNDFLIDQQDSDFYAKIKVPAPTFCPECRLQRRLAFFNLVNLYKRPCDLCGKDAISVYAPDNGYVVYCPKCWWSDAWDPLSYGREYDPSRNFLEQFNELMHAVPHLGLTIELSANETSPFTNYTGSLKNCYLVFSAERDEDAYNGVQVWDSRTILDSSLVMHCERCYDSMHVYKIHNGVGLRNQVTESFDVSFLRDCANCQHCFGSANLRNKKYYFFNDALTKEAYDEAVQKIDLGSYAAYQEIQEKVSLHWDSLPYKGSYIDMSPECTGNLIFNSKNCRDSFELLNCQDSRYIAMTRNMKDSYDVTSWSDVELSCDSLSIGQNASNVKYSAIGAIGASDVEYCFLVIAGTGFFGSVSIKKGQYCILNKQYSKEEFYKLRERIIQDMKADPYRDSTGLVYPYGEFFPIELSPWAYNDTIAQRLFPLSKEAAEGKGYGWIDKEKSQHAITVDAAELPDHIKDASDAITGEVIGCKKCGKGYKIPKKELEMLRFMRMPLPRECPFCRIEQKLDVWLSESKMMQRTCGKCGKAIDVPYSLKDKPLIYCKECYQKEVI